jgi:phenylalanyl-tRNA synthetase alpha chain
MATPSAARFSPSSNPARPPPPRLPLPRFLPPTPPQALLRARPLRTSAAVAAAAAVVEVGGVKIAREDVVKEEDPTNNVPDTIYSKIGLQLHRRDNHPLGILKNTIYDYFDKNFSGNFNKFDDLCPLVSIKQNFDDVLVPADHVSRSYNDTYYVDAQTVLRCHTSAHQAELLRDGHTHFLVTGDVYRRDSIDSTHYPCFHQMEGFRVFTPDEWSDSGMDGTAYAAADLKKTLEGLAKHLFGKLVIVSSVFVTKEIYQIYMHWFKYKETCVQVLWKCDGLTHTSHSLTRPLNSRYIFRSLYKWIYLFFMA